MNSSIKVSPVQRVAAYKKHPGKPPSVETLGAFIELGRQEVQLENKHTLLGHLCKMGFYKEALYLVETQKVNIESVNILGQSALTVLLHEALPKWSVIKINEEYTKVAKENGDYTKLVLTLLKSGASPMVGTRHILAHIAGEARLWGLFPKLIEDVGLRFDEVFKVQREEYPGVMQNLLTVWGHERFDNKGLQTIMYCMDHGASLSEPHVNMILKVMNIEFATDKKEKEPFTVLNWLERKFGTEFKDYLPVVEYERVLKERSVLKSVVSKNKLNSETPGVDSETQETRVEHKSCEGEGDDSVKPSSKSVPKSVKGRI